MQHDGRQLTEYKKGIFKYKIERCLLKVDWMSALINLAVNCYIKAIFGLFCKASTHFSMIACFTLFSIRQRHA